MRASSRGFTIFELLVAISIAGIMTGMGLFAFRQLDDPASDGAGQLMGFLKKGRSRAMASTSAYTLKPASTTTLQATTGTSCTATQTADPSMNLTLPNGAILNDTTWSICYTARGLANSSASILIHDSNSTKTIQVVLGGAVRVL